jgi:hypothetical protein
VPLQLGTPGTYDLFVRIGDPALAFLDQTAEAEITVTAPPPVVNDLIDCLLAPEGQPALFSDLASAIDLTTTGGATPRSVAVSIAGRWCSPNVPRPRRVDIERDVIRILLEADPERFVGAPSPPFSVDLALGDLLPGRYLIAVSVTDANGAEDQALLGAGTVDVGSKSTLTCVPGPTTLCLDSLRYSNRFQVDATWTPRDGSPPRAAAARRLTEQTGTFTFFDRANVEVVLKVLEACQPPFERFWVFAAGLTDLEVELTVTDTFTGEQRSYGSADGTSFDEIRDTDAFECP